VFRFWLFAILIPACAWADCTPRKFTPNEEKTAQQISAALQSAVSPAPAGWQDSLASTRFVTGLVCAGMAPSLTDYVNSTFTYSIQNPPSRREYPEEKEMKRLRNERDALTRRPDSVRQKINEIRARASEKMRASKAAERAGNQEEARRLRQEYDLILKEETPVIQEFEASIAPQLKEIDAKIQQLSQAVPDYDTRVWVRLLVSAQSRPSTPDPKPGQGLNEDVYIWQRSGQPPYPGAVSRVVLQIKGWPDYRETVTRLIDQEKLAALVK
jgi:hypothetical protein